MNKRQQTTPPPETLPQDWKTEGEVIATLLEGERASYILEAGLDLYTNPAYKEIFSAALALKDKGISPDYCTMIANYPGLRSAITGAITGVLTDLQLDSAIAALSNLADQRRCKALGEKLVANPQDPFIIEQVAAALSEPSNLLGYCELLKNDTTEEIRASIAKDKGGIGTGYWLNTDDTESRRIELTIPPAALTLVCGLSGHCKSVFLRNLALSLARKRDVPGDILYFSFEETKPTTELRLLNAYIALDLNNGGNNIETLREYEQTGSDRYITETKREEFKAKREEYYKLRESGRLRIYGRNFTTAELVREVKKFLRQRKIAAIFCDYVQFMRSGKEGLQIREDILDTAGQLLNLAKSTGLPVICAAQFNKQVKGPDQMTSNNIAECVDLTRNASTIIGLWNARKCQDLDKGAAEGREAYEYGKFKGFIDGSAGVVYMEITKSRDIAVGPWANLEFNGNTGVIATDLPEGSAPKNSAQENNKFVKDWK